MRIAWFARMPFTPNRRASTAAPITSASVTPSASTTFSTTVARSMSMQRADALLGADDVRQPDSEFVVHDDDLAVRDQRAVHEHVERLACHARELDHGAARELKQTTDADARATHLHRQAHRNVQHDVEI